MNDHRDSGLPAAPAGFKPETFFEGQAWHQKWEVFPGVFTPGVNSVAKLFRHAGIPDDLSGVRVLDIGAWNGCCSFECERRGAGEVVAFSLENPAATGFTKLKDLLGSRVRYVQGSVYTLSPETLGTFDVVLFFGVLYHLRYPLLAIDRIRCVSRKDVFIETHVVPDSLFLRRPLSLRQRLALKLVSPNGLFARTPVWRQYKEFELHPEDQSNWFGPNPQAVLESFDSAGFEVRHLVTIGGGTRAYFKATAREHLPQRLLEGAYEGQSELNATLAGITGRKHHKLFDTSDSGGGPVHQSRARRRAQPPSPER